MKIMIILALLFGSNNFNTESYEIFKYNQSVLEDYTVIDYVYDYFSEIILTNYYKILDKE